MFCSVVAGNKTWCFFYRQKSRRCALGHGVPENQICRFGGKTQQTSRFGLGRWTDVNVDHGMREAHSVGVRQHHAPLIAGLVVVVFLQGCGCNTTLKNSRWRRFRKGNFGGSKRLYSHPVASKEWVINFHKVTYLADRFECVFSLGGLSSLSSLLFFLALFLSFKKCVEFSSFSNSYLGISKFHRRYNDFKMTLKL